MAPAHRASSSRRSRWTPLLNEAFKVGAVELAKLEDSQPWHLQVFADRQGLGRGSLHPRSPISAWSGTCEDTGRLFPTRARLAGRKSFAAGPVWPGAAQLGEVLRPFPLRGAPLGRESIFVATVVGTSSDRSSRTRQTGLPPCISQVKLVRNPATCARCWSLNDLNREMLVVG